VRLLFALGPLACGHLAGLLAVGLLAACDEPVPVEAQVAEASAPVTGRADPAGRWDGDGHCLELYANGDFALSRTAGPGPKHLLMGSARLRGDTLTLRTRRIWRARWVSRCRRDHRGGGWEESLEVLGRRFAPGEVTTLTLRGEGDSRELCGARCVPLERTTPTLVGHFERERAARGDVLAVRPGERGELEVMLDEPTSVGTCEATHEVGDRFTIRCTPRVEEPSAVEALGPTPWTLTAERRTEERLRVCRGERCAALERRFDAFHWGFD